EVLSTSADPESADGALSSTSSESADAELQRVLQDLRRWAGAASEHRDYLLRMSRQLREKEVVGSKAVTDGSETRPAAEEKMIFSSRAGLVLLLPMVFSLRLHSCYTMADLRSAIWVAGAEEGEAEDSEEAWLKELLPDDQQSLPTGMLPTGWQLGLSVERQ